MAMSRSSSPDIVCDLTRWLRLHILSISKDYLVLLNRIEEAMSSYSLLTLAPISITSRFFISLCSNSNLNNVFTL